MPNNYEHCILSGKCTHEPQNHKNKSEINTLFLNKSVFLLYIRTLGFNYFLKQNMKTISLCACKQRLSPFFISYLSFMVHIYFYINFCLSIMIFCV